MRRDGPPGKAPEWTRDESGAYVDWTIAPYSDGRGHVRLSLESEDPARIPYAVMMQRIREFYLLTWRAGGLASIPRRSPPVERSSKT